MASLPYADTRRPSWAGSFIVRFAALRARLAKARKARRELEALRGASDHILSDIGVTRGELDRALAGPIWANPADRLMRRR